MGNELLPCPFCGNEAEILTAESMHGGYLFGIMCNDCRSRGDVYDTEAKVIAAWNTRAGRICTCGWHGFIDGWGHDAPNYCPNCGGRVMRYD